MRGHEFGLAGPGLAGPGLAGPMMAGYLNLTDAQQTQMKAILQKERPALKPLMAQLRQTREALKQYEEGAYDEAKVTALATQQTQTMVQLTVQQTRIHNELFQVLTADQQTKLKEFEAKREARMEQRQNEASAPPEE
jgi:Spy/CpxP family protein refolding chaperone